MRRRKGDGRISWRSGGMEFAMVGSADRNQGEPVERLKDVTIRGKMGEVKSILVKERQFAGGVGSRNATGYVECR